MVFFRALIRRGSFGALLCGSFLCDLFCRVSSVCSLAGGFFGALFSKDFFRVLLRSDSFCAILRVGFFNEFCREGFLPAFFSGFFVQTSSRWVLPTWKNTFQIFFSPNMMKKVCIIFCAIRFVGSIFTRYYSKLLQLFFSWVGNIEKAGRPRRRKVIWRFIVDCHIVIVSNLLRIRPQWKVFNVSDLNMPLFVHRSHFPVHFWSSLVDALQGREDWICHLRIVFQLHSCFVHGQHRSLELMEHQYQVKRWSHWLEQTNLDNFMGFPIALQLPSHRLWGFSYAISSLSFKSSRKEDNVCQGFVWNTCHRNHSKFFVNRNGFKEMLWRTNFHVVWHHVVTS